MYVTPFYMYTFTLNMHAAAFYIIIMYSVTFCPSTPLYFPCKKVSSYIAQYPVLRTVQSTLHFTSLTDLFKHTPSQLLWEAPRHMLQLMCEGCSYTYPPLSIARYSFIQVHELEQCRVKKLAQDFNTAAQDSNPGPLSRESKALPRSHCALYAYTHVHIPCTRFMYKGHQDVYVNRV